MGGVLAKGGVRACVGGVLAWVVWVACLYGWRANLGYLVDMLAWVTWQRR